MAMAMAQMKLIEDRDQIEKLLDTLTPREKGVLTIRFLEGCTLREAAEEYGVSIGRIRQVQARALNKLKGRKELL